MIVGAGIVVLATGYALLSRRPGLRVRIVEKETQVGRHQSTHNSGVLHAGLYYAPGSLKARLAVSGLRRTASSTLSVPRTLVSTTDSGAR